MLALSFMRSVPRYALIKASRGNPRVATGDFSVLHFGNVPAPELPTAEWERVYPRLSGICGSDLASITGHVSFYLDPLTSYPFIPGHEVVGELKDGTRVVVEPALGCSVRGIADYCPSCQSGRPGLCENLNAGDLPIGLQTGYCSATGGGWGEVLVAHPSQLYPVPEKLPDEAAVLIEPLACCIHAALRGGAQPEDVVVVQGAGTIGLLTVAALRRFTPPRRLIAVAKHPVQREHALRLGADQVITPAESFQRIRFATGARRLDGRDRPLLLGGADLTFECTGTAGGINDAVRYTRAGGRVMVVGMPGEEKVDWAPIWQRELTIMGAYAYGLEKIPPTYPPPQGGRNLQVRREVPTFQLALEVAEELELERLTGPLYALADYRSAITDALRAGRIGAVKLAFDLRPLRDKSS